MRTTKKGKFFLYLILTLGALLILFPMYITITTTFKTPAESAVSFFTLPKSLYLGNYATVLQDEKLYYAYGNTILITVVSLLGEMLILPPMGFALSRGMKQNRFFKGLYFFFLLGIFLPWQVRMMPVVKLMGWLGLLSPLGITLLYVAHATCESMFLYVGYLSTVSDSIEEAAYIDGAGDLRVYWSIILPLSKRAIATVAIIGFIGNWNSYMWPKVVATKESLRTVQTGLRMLMQSDFGDDWGSIMAAATLITMPMILFFVCLQRYFVQGITKVGLK